MDNEKYFNWDNISVDRKIETESSCNGVTEKTRCKMGILGSDNFYYRCGRIANNPDIYCPIHGGKKKDRKEQVEKKIKRLSVRQQKAIDYIKQEIKRLSSLRVAINQLNKEIKELEAEINESNLI